MTGTTERLDRAALARWRNAIVVAFALGGITLSTWGPRLPAIKQDLGLTAGGIGLLLTATTIGSVCGLLLSTPLLARFGSRGAVRLVLLVMAGALVVIGVSSDVLHSAGTMAVGFLLVGLAIGSFDVMINVEGAALEAASTRTLMPFLHAAWSVGAAIGSGIGAASAGLGVPPSGQFSGEAVLVAAAGVLLPRAIPVHDAAVTEAEERLPVGRRIVGWLRGWTDVRLLLIGLVMLGAELGEGSANTWLTLSTQREHGQTAAVAALFFTVFALGEATARVLGGPLVDRFGRVRTTRVTLALGVLGTVLFILTDSWWLVLIGVVLWSIGVSMGFPLGMSAAAESGPNPAARVSVVASIGYFANLAGPPAVGFLADATDLLTALWLIAVLFIAAIAAAGSFRPRPACPFTDEAGLRGTPLAAPGDRRVG